jgi:hypothetical protein
MIYRFPFASWETKTFQAAVRDLKEELSSVKFTVESDGAEHDVRFEVKVRGERVGGTLRFGSDEGGASLVIDREAIDRDALADAERIADALCRRLDGRVEDTGRDRPFADWAALMAYAREIWVFEDEGVEGDWFERIWDWTDDERTQLVTIARLDFDGDVWVSWSSAIADADAMTDEQVAEAMDAEVGRIVRNDGCWWLEQYLPFAQLTPALLDRLSDSFAERADDLELRVTGGDQD